MRGAGPTFHDAGFFRIPRTDPKRIFEDVTVVRLTYRDERRIHEVVDARRQIPRLTELEKRMKAATDVDPRSATLFRKFVLSSRHSSMSSKKLRFMRTKAMQSRSPRKYASFMYPFFGRTAFSFTSLRPICKIW